MFLIRLIDRLSLWAGMVAAVLVLPLVGAMVFEVVSRYAFSAPTYWAFELAYMMMGSIFLLGMAYALSIGAHVNVDFLHQKLPPRAVALIDFVGYALLTGMCVWMTWALGRYAMNAFNSGEGTGLSSWNPKVWPYRVVYAVGFAMFTLQTAAKTLENLLVMIYGPRHVRGDAQ